MATDQKVMEFQTLAGWYARGYAPANWKIVAFGQNIFDLAPWLTRVRASNDDIEFLEICAEYVHRLRDGHSSFRIPSTWIADMGVYTDIYDGKVLIEAIDRSMYPTARFPFQIGDELVSIDGRSVEAIMTDLQKFLPFGSPRGIRRRAADYLGFRPQTIFPGATRLGDTATVVIRRASTGAEETYELAWSKFGEPFTSTQRIPDFIRSADDAAADDNEALLRRWTNLSADLDRSLMRQRNVRDEEGVATNREALLGYGARTPYYRLPAGFRVRRGAAASDFTLSGTYEADGKRIGLMRIPSFSPANILAAIREIDAEVTFFNANTDGLVIDVSRNPGGICQLVTDVAARFIPRPFYVTPHQLMATQTEIQRTANALANARAFGAPWVVATYQFTLDALRAAQKEQRAMTGPLPLCQKLDTNTFTAPGIEDNQPWRDATGQIGAYAKPLIVLVDDFSVSAGDIFPAIMQDNKRGPIVGYRTGGLGGYVENTPAGPFSESITRVTKSMMIRREAVKAPELPAAPYVENIGVLPDIELDYMTRNNLMTSGADFVAGFTRIILDEIARPRTQ